MSRAAGSGTTISVVMATYNREAAARDALLDLLRQTRPPDEILVVDQSDDQARARRMLSLPGVRYLRLDRPNAQRARNAGILAARGEVVLMVDDDVRVPPGFVAAHARNYGDGRIDGVAGQTLEPGQRPTEVLPPEHAWPHDGWMFFPLNYARRAEGVINWPSCNASVRRELAIRAGGFDEQFARTFWDDADFSWRLHHLGARLVFDPQASLLHLRVPSGGRRPARRNRHVWADTEYWGTLFYFWRKNFGLWPVRRHVWWYVRHLICRKALLARPHQLFLAAAHMAAGYRWAGRRLREGPRHLVAAGPPPLAADAPQGGT